MFITEGNIKEIQLINKGRTQPDVEFEFIDSIISAIVHADPESHAMLSVINNRITMHIQPSTPAFKQSIIDNLVSLNRLLKIKVVFSSSLKISKKVSFSIEM